MQENYLQPNKKLCVHRSNLSGHTQFDPSYVPSVSTRPHQPELLELQTLRWELILKHLFILEFMIPTGLHESTVNIIDEVEMISVNFLYHSDIIL